MRFRSLASWLVAPATLGLLPPPCAAAETPGSAPPPVRDVALADDGLLYGAVVDPQGHGLAKTEVLLAQPGGASVRVLTADDGRFAVARLPGGVYEASAAGRSGVVRVWQRTSAPPGARSTVVIVAGGETIRGQAPRTGFMKSDAFLISAAIVGAVAIPVFISVSAQDLPPGS